MIKIKKLVKTHIKLKIFLFFGTIWDINIYSKPNIKYIIENVDYKNYNKLIEDFEENKKNTAEYWYYYAVLLRKIILLHILSDKLDYYIDEFKEKIRKSISFKNNKYKILSVNEFIYMYNLFLERGCEYINNAKYDEANKALTIAKSFNDTTEVNIKLGFLKQLEGNYKEAIQIYNDAKSKTRNKDLLKIIDINTIKILLEEKSFDKIIEIIKPELEKNSYNIQLIEILSTLKHKFNVKIDDLLSKNKDIKEIQNAIIYYFNKEYKKAYEILNKSNIKKTELLILFSDVLYNYSVDLQSNTFDNKLLKSLIDKNIEICNKIINSEYKNKKIIKRLINLHLALKEYEKADLILKKHKIKLII